MKIAKLIKSILLSTGAGSVLTLIISFFSEKIARPGFFQAMIFGMIFVGISCWLFYDKKLLSPNIWVRRFLSIVLNYFIMFTSMLLFGVFTPTPTKLLIGIGAGLGITLLVGVPLCYFADCAEKKQLRQINEKLEKNR